MISLRTVLAGLAASGVVLASAPLAMGNGNLRAPDVGTIEKRECAKGTGAIRCTATSFAGGTLADRSLRGSDLRDSGFQGTTIRGVDLTGARIEGAVFTRARIINSRLADVNRGHASRDRTRFQHALVRGTRISGNLSRALFTGADLRGQDMSGAVLRRAKFTGADLRGTDLRRADLRGAVLRGADLRGADLRGARLQGAQLQAARLERADLRGAALRGASLQRAALGRTDLRGTPLAGVDLTLADARGARLGSRSPSTSAGRARLMREARVCGTAVAGGAAARAVPGRLPRWGGDAHRGWRTGWQQGSRGPGAIGGRTAPVLGTPGCGAAAQLSPRPGTAREASSGCGNWVAPDCAHFMLNWLSFSNMYVPGGDFYMTQFMGGRLTNMWFAGGFFGYANFTRAYLDNVNLTGITPGILPSTASGTFFDGATAVNGTKISGNLQWAQFLGADMSGVDFSGANLANANFDSADVSGANFTGANLTGAQMDAANASGANFSGANLTNANLDSANMSNVVLDGATLRGTQMTGASLDGADLGNAAIYGASWYYADLSKVSQFGVYGIPTANLGPEWAYAAGYLPAVLDISGYTCVTTVPGSFPSAQGGGSGNWFPSTTKQNNDDCNLVLTSTFDVLKSVASVALAIAAPEATAFSIARSVASQIVGAGERAMPQQWWESFLQAVFA